MLSMDAQTHCQTVRETERQKDGDTTVAQGCY
jgi:hypothetical protein